MPKDLRFNAAAVATWWQENLYSGQAVIARSDPQACNGFAICSFSQRIFLRLNFPDEEHGGFGNEWVVEDASDVHGSRESSDLS